VFVTHGTAEHDENMLGMADRQFEVNTWAKNLKEEI
jgi:hypothetical protein